MTNKILVCLLSEQHVPNLLSVHHLRPVRLVLVVTGQMATRRADAYFAQALEHGGLTYAPHVCKIAQEDSVEETRAALRAAYDQLAPAHPGAEWVVNYTGGTKPMSIGAYELAREINARSLYINVSRPASLLFAAPGEGVRIEACPHTPGIREFLAGYGFEDKKPDAAHVASAAFARRTWECARVLAAHADDQDVLRLCRDEHNEVRKGRLILTPAHTAHLPPPVKDELATQFGLRSEPSGLTGPINEAAGKFLTGGWLEVFLFGLLDHHKSALGCSDLRLGVAPAKDQVANDLDVAFMRDFGLTWIECKTGGQGHDPSADARFKVEAVTAQFRALRAKAILASTSDNILRDGKINPAMAWRAELCGYRIVDRERIRRLAAPDCDAARIHTTLFGGAR